MCNVGCRVGRLQKKAKCTAETAVELPPDAGALPTATRHPACYHFHDVDKQFHKLSLRGDEMRCY